MRLQILVPLDTYPERDTDDLARQVAAVAKHLTADVHALVLNADFPHLSSVLGNMLLDAPALISGAKAQCRARGLARLQQLQATLAAEQIPLRVTHAEYLIGTAGSAINAQAPYCDLVLLEYAGDGVQAAAQAVIFGAGRPVLLLPETAAPLVLDQLMIAWDGSRAACRAVGDARDFLARASRVGIVLASGDKPLPAPDPAASLVQYLAQHAVTATSAQLALGGQPLGQLLQQHAQQAGAGLLVMGGFAHSRLHDWVLGSATGEVLQDLRLPVLLSH